MSACSAKLAKALRLGVSLSAKVIAVAFTRLSTLN
jgi:hypothetical protein